MANPDEIVDQIASFGLFADLATPQLEGVAHTFEERWYAEGERVLRQGLTGSAFHIILEGEATVVIDGEERATLARGDFLRLAVDAAGMATPGERKRSRWRVLTRA